MAWRRVREWFAIGPRQTWANLLRFCAAAGGAEERPVAHKFGMATR